MLKKKYRLPILRNIERLKNKRSVITDLFVIKISENNLSNSRFGFSVSKAIDKRSVVRNRIKRLLRSIIEEKLSEIAQGYDFLFIAKGKAKESDRKRLLETVLNSLKREKLLK